MRPTIRNLIKRLEHGLYMVNVKTVSASACPITTAQRNEYERIAGEFAATGKHPKDWEPGFYLIRVDQHSNAIDVTGMNQQESQAFIREVLGAC